jgi:hypothetical protein
MGSTRATPAFAPSVVIVRSNNKLRIAAENGLAKYRTFTAKNR